MRQTVTGEAEDYLAGVDRQAGVPATGSSTYSIVPVIGSALQLAAAVHRHDHLDVPCGLEPSARLHRGGTWGPGWAIAGWLLPPFVCVIPTLMLVEMWKASDPDVPIGGDWRTKTRRPAGGRCGCVLYTVGPVMSLAANASAARQFGETDKAIAERAHRRPVVGDGRRVCERGGGRHVRVARAAADRPAHAAHRRSVTLRPRDVDGRPLPRQACQGR